MFTLYLSFLNPTWTRVKLLDLSARLERRRAATRNPQPVAQA
jgi:hypothetical protein